MHEPKPLIAVTMGDPAGVGPEIVVGAWLNGDLHRWCRPLVLGHPEILRRAVRLWEAGLQVAEIDAPGQAGVDPGVIPCVPCGPDDALQVPPGTLDARAGQAAYEAVVAAARLALSGRVDAITTAPLHKEALHRAGYRYPGHTELLAEMCGRREVAMVLYLGPNEQLSAPAGLAVAHVTLHVALKDAIGQLDPETILTRARLVDRFMAEMKGARPRVGVCALNPHAGEGGLFGHEERTIIAPAVERGRAEGMQLEGPMPADTLMVRARDGRFDAVVAMYHDQGHIALKLLGMHRAVNVTLGLPIIRTSVAHGTAFDIAWRRRAETGSLLEAIRVAGRLAASGRP